MSRNHIEQLLLVRDEFDAAREAIAYVLKNWTRQTITFDRITPRDLQFTQRNLELTYFVRLYAEFEGILKTHLAEEFPAVALGSKPKVDALISKVKKAEQFRISPQLQKKLERVRDYRNSIAHKSSTMGVITFADALATLNTFLDKLS